MVAPDRPACPRPAPQDALLACSEAAKLFIHYLAATANDACRDAKRQTVSADDVLTALDDLEFGELVEPLKAALEGEAPPRCRAALPLVGPASPAPVQSRWRKRHASLPPRMPSPDHAFICSARWPAAYRLEAKDKAKKRSEQQTGKKRKGGAAGGGDDAAAAAAEGGGAAPMDAEAS